MHLGKLWLLPVVFKAIKIFTVQVLCSQGGFQLLLLGGILACLGGQWGWSGEADPKPRGSFMRISGCELCLVLRKEQFGHWSTLSSRAGAALAKGTLLVMQEILPILEFLGLASLWMIKALKEIWFPPGFLASLFGALCSPGFLQIHWSVVLSMPIQCLGALSSSAALSCPAAAQSQKDRHHFYISSFQVEAVKKGSE